jgi:hypothetical protein
MRTLPPVSSTEKPRNLHLSATYSRRGFGHKKAFRMTVSRTTMCARCTRANRIITAIAVLPTTSGQVQGIDDRL